LQPLGDLGLIVAKGNKEGQHEAGDVIHYVAAEAGKEDVYTCYLLRRGRPNQPN
jgi:hypothetical protein